MAWPADAPGAPGQDCHQPAAAAGGAFGGGGGSVFLSGGQDGAVRAWDLRVPGGRSVAECRAHAGNKGRGAVTAIVAGA